MPLNSHPDPAAIVTVNTAGTLNVLSWTDVSRGTVNGAEGRMSSFMVWSLGDDVGRPGMRKRKGDSRQ